MTGRYALTGRVVTMDAASTVHTRGTVYVDGSRIAAVQDAAAAPPQQFAGLAPVELGVTIYPGLVELHNHLSYDTLPLWQVPERYANRGLWQADPRYEQLVSRPMGAVGKAKTLIPAVVRYVESKCLMGGVTTTQGVRLISDAGIVAYYRGTVRVVESPRDHTLPAAASRVADVAAADRDAFLKTLQGNACVILHLAEGRDATARKHFTDLQYPGSTRWALAPSLAGIHCAALTEADFTVMHAHGASMVWSPLSNLLLYGDTADVAAAHRQGVLIALGSDWSPSGSRSLLGELKVAHALTDMRGLPFSERDLLAMATCNPAAMLHWNKAVGSIAAGMRADLLLVDGVGGDPYNAIFRATETAVAAVIVDGVPHYGHQAAMSTLGVAGGEEVTVGAAQQLFSFLPSAEHPGMERVSFASAKAQLQAGLANPPTYLPPAGAGLHAGRELPELRVARPHLPETGWTLELDELGGTGEAMRPLIGAGRELAPSGLMAVQPPLPLVALQLGEATVAGDATWFDALAAEPNLPAGLVAGLQALA